MSRTRKEITRFAKAQKQCARLAKRDLERFWKTLDTTDVVACREALEDFLPQLVQAYGNIGGQLAVGWYDELPALAAITRRSLRRCLVSRRCMPGSAAP